ncbi:MAG: MBL fold metallo-hydrolase [Verrucomicrobia bacterium]|nr:MBL fold metallo-hydrolase [Verrucomicrobiota bacterium]
MKLAVQKEGALLQDIRDAPASDDLHIWWLGQSGFLCQSQGRHLLFDPYLSDSLSIKYAATDKPHVRMTERVIDPSDLDMVAVVTSSHNHTDHLDGETLLPLAAANPSLVLVLPEANKEFATARLKQRSIPMEGLNTGTTRKVNGFEITGITAAHNSIDRDDAGNSRYLGFVAIVGSWKVYHSGDTLWHPDLVPELLALGPIDVMFLPINGNKPERRVAGNLNGMEAAALAKACGARVVIPCHYDMFTFNTDTPDEFVTACERLDQPARVMQNGERFSLSHAYL